jgi:hypothetical protein
MLDICQIQLGKSLSQVLQRRAFHEMRPTPEMADIRLAVTHGHAAAAQSTRYYAKALVVAQDIVPEDVHRAVYACMTYMQYIALSSGLILPIYMSSYLPLFSAIFIRAAVVAQLASIFRLNRVSYRRLHCSSSSCYWPRLPGAWLMARCILLRAGRRGCGCANPKL